MPTREDAARWSILIALLMAGAIAVGRAAGEPAVKGYLAALVTLMVAIVLSDFATQLLAPLLERRSPDDDNTGRAPKR